MSAKWPPGGLLEHLRSILERLGVVLGRLEGLKVSETANLERPRGPVAGTQEHLLGIPQDVFLVFLMYILSILLRKRKVKKDMRWRGR